MKYVRILFLVAASACANGPTGSSRKPVEVVELAHVPRQLSEEEIFSRCETMSADCEQLCLRDGLTRACSQMSYFYSGTPGVAKDTSKEFHFSERGCQAGDGDACSYCAAMSQRGRGTQKSPARRLEFLDRACKLGEGEDCFSAAEQLEYGPPDEKPVAAALTEVDERRIDDYWARGDAIGKPEEPDWPFAGLSVACDHTSPVKKSGCRRYLTTALGRLANIPKFEERRDAIRLRLLRGSCDLLPSQECDDLPPPPHDRALDDDCIDCVNPPHCGCPDEGSK